MAIENFQKTLSPEEMEGIKKQVLAAATPEDRKNPYAERTYVKLGIEKVIKERARIVEFELWGMAGQ